ncbi:hypothetical protein TWF281_005029 [Arthrobotrys megalospora]
MLNYARLNILVLALLAFVSFCTARTIVTINGKCSTRYCGYLVPKSKIYKTTKVIHTTGRYTVTRWKTVTKPKATKTSTGTKNIASTVYKTISTVTSVSTKYSTVTRTSTSTETVTTIGWTLPITTKTLQSTSTIPAPSGFVGVNDDPDNKSAGADLPKPGESKLKQRNAEAEPEPEPAANAKYVTAITCTKTLLTKTGTSDLWKTTTKSTGTITKKVWTTKTHYTTKTVTKNGAPTVRTTITNVVTVTTPIKVTLTVAGATYLTTVTTSLPQTSFYAACGPRNTGPPPEHQILYYAYGAEADFGESTKIVWSNGTAYDCCVECQTYSGPGICLGSVYGYQGAWGAPDCFGLPDWEECPPFEPKWYSKCELTIAENKPGTCRTHKYKYEWYYNQPPTMAFNGPSCKRFKYQKRSE